MVNLYLSKGIGDDFLQMGKFKNALENYENALKIKNDNKEILISKGLSLNGLGDFESAIKIFESILMTNPLDEAALKGKSSTYIQLGCEKLKNKIFDNALKYFDDALKIDNNTKKALIGKGIALNGLKNFENALKIFEEILKDYNSNIHALDGKLKSLKGNGEILLKR